MRKTTRRSTTNEPISSVHVDQAVMEMVTKGRAFTSSIGAAFFSRNKIRLQRKSDGSDETFEVDEFCRKFARVGFRRVNPIALPA